LPTLVYPERFYPWQSGLSYVPSGFTPHPRQYGNFFTGAGPKPRDGRPCLLHCDLGGWSVSNRAGYFSATGSDATASSSLHKDGLPWRAIQRGWSVFSVAATVTAQVDSAGAVISGKGLFRKASDTDGAGTNLFQTKSFPEKDMCWATQYLRKNAATLGINPDLIVAKGTSAGADAVAWATFSPNFSDTTGFHSGWKSRPNAVIVLNPQALFPLIGETGVPGEGSTAFTMHFPRETGSAAADWNTAAAAYSGAAGFDASNGGTDFSRLEDASILKVAWGSSINALNKLVPTYLYGVTLVPTSAPFGADPVFSTTPTAANWSDANYTSRYGGLDLTAEDPFHNSAHVYAWKEIAEKGNGMLFGSKGGVSRLVVHPTCAPTSSWGATKVKPDSFAGTDQSAFSAETEDQLEFLEGVVRRL